MARFQKLTSGRATTGSAVARKATARDRVSILSLASWCRLEEVKMMRTNVAVSVQTAFVHSAYHRLHHKEGLVIYCTAEARKHPGQRTHRTRFALAWMERRLAVRKVPWFIIRN